VLELLRFDARADQGCGVVELFGEADSYALDVLRRARCEALRVAGCPASVVVVCDGVEFMDAAGFGSLVSFYTQLRAMGGALALCGTDGPVARIIRIAGLSKVLPVFRSLDEALDWFDRREG
jgi:anti-anti-sigma factor